MFKPDSKFRLLWDFISILLIFYQILLIPFEISFDADDKNNVLKFIDLAINCYFLADICLNFNTGYYSRRLLILDRKQIAVHYLKKWFWIDLLASFPYSLLFGVDFSNQESGNIRSINIIRNISFIRLAKILRLIRIFKFKKIFIKLESIMFISPSINRLLGFFKINLIILVIAHWIACVWHLVGLMELDQQPNTWMTKAEIVDLGWSERYVTSMYWAVTTMTTVGYGDIVPTNDVERIIIVFVELIASVVFAFAMNSINNLLVNTDSSSSAYR